MKNPQTTQCILAIIQSSPSVRIITSPPLPEIFLFQNGVSVVPCEEKENRAGATLNIGRYYGDMHSRCIESLLRGRCIGDEIKRLAADVEIVESVFPFAGAP